MTIGALPAPAGGLPAPSPTGGGLSLPDAGGRIAGGIIGGAIGSLFGPLGTLAGRAIGSRVGPYVARAAAAAIQSMMEDANEATDEELSDAKQEEDVCQDCARQECIDLEEQMKDEIYANKRAPGEDGQPRGGKHGLRLRRAEQICGEYGPGETRMESRVRNGVRILREVVPWDTHRREIQEMQDRLADMYEEYNRLGCKGHKDSNISLGQVEGAVEPGFNPSDEEWLGRDHPLCDGLSDLIRSNPAPELPRFPRPGSGSGGDLLS